MAGKKKSILVSSQKWEDVPEIPKEEQPYPLPVGWKWVRLKDVYQINPKIEADDNLLASFVSMDKISNGMDGYFTYEVDKWEKIKKGHTRFANGDVAFAKISPCFENGKKMLVQNLKNGIGAGTTELIILRNPDILQKFTFYLISTEDFIKNGVKTYSGTVGQQRISMEFVRNYFVPLPPLETQQRIVNRIESIFSKLDEAAEKIQEVINSHEARKQAILYKAFSGELTRKWRKENGIGLDSWERGKLGDYVEIQYGYTGKSTIEEVGPKFLRITDIQSEGIDWKRVPYCEINKKDYSNYKLHINDIVIARTGATTGKSYFIQDKVDSIFASYLIRVRVKRIDILSERFLYLFLNSPQYWKQINELSSGTAQQGVNGNKIKTLIVPLPRIEEQIKIEEILKSTLLDFDKIYKTTKLFYKYIYIIKNIILKFFIK